VLCCVSMPCTWLRLWSMPLIEREAALHRTMLTYCWSLICSERTSQVTGALPTQEAGADSVASFLLVTTTTATCQSD
jgi:hypothetical protein